MERSGRLREALEGAGIGLCIVAGSIMVADTLDSVFPSMPRTEIAVPDSPTPPEHSGLSPDSPQVLWSENFDGSGDARDFIPGLPTGDIDNVSITPTQNDGGMLDIEVPSDGALATSTVAKGGGFIAQFEKDLNIQELDEAWFSYDFIPPENSYAGGKMISLAGSNHGYAYSNGGVIRGDTWGGLILFGNNDSLVPSAYLYVPGLGGERLEDHTDEHGKPRGFWPKFSEALIPNQANRIEPHYKMNTGSNDDGVFEAYVNGKLALRITDVQYRKDENGPGINLLVASPFFGGPEPNDRDQRLRFDNLVISTQRNG